MEVLDYTQLAELQGYRPLIDVEPDDVGLPHARTCPYCSGDARAVDNIFETDWGYLAALLACAQCGWWCQYAVGANRDGYFEVERVPASLRRYSPQDIELPVSSLRRELSRKPDLVDELSPGKMEELVGSILGDFIQCEVIHTGCTGDGGVDLLLVEGEKQYVVQVKRRLRKGRGEPVSVVREFLGATLLAGESRGIFVTSATHFTPAAVDAADTAVARGLVEKFELVDRRRFLELLHLVSDRTLPPWRAFYVHGEGLDDDQVVKVRFRGERDSCEWVTNDEWGNEVVKMRVDRLGEHRFE